MAVISSSVNPYNLYTISWERITELRGLERGKEIGKEIGKEEVKSVSVALLQAVRYYCPW